MPRVETPVLSFITNTVLCCFDWLTPYCHLFTSNRETLCHPVTCFHAEEAVDPRVFREVVRPVGFSNTAGQ